MATVAFPFVNHTANRLANIITKDIEKIERTVFGTVTNWQAKFTSPFKAHYANDILKRATSAQVLHIDSLLPTYEKRAREYMASPNRKGRPLTVHINLEEPADMDNAPVQDAQDPANNNDELSRDIAQILADGAVTDNVPVPMKRSAPVPAPTPDANPDAQAALRALMAALTPKAQAVEIDEALVREIARDEANKAIKPTVIHIQPVDNAPVIDMGVQHCSFAMLVNTLQCKFPVWLPGPAGSGKTTAARNAATALSVPFHHTGAVDNVYQLLGFIDAGGTYHPTEFRRAYEDGGVFLWDEVDASNPAALVAFNAALENGHCAFPDKVVEKHADCYFVAAANTYGQGATHEYVGRTKIDAATVDRFVMIDWQYDEILERAIAGDNDWTKYVQNVRRACKDAGIKHLVTPRASIRGNALLASGVDREAVVNMTVRKGLSDDNWNTITYRVRG